MRRAPPAGRTARVSDMLKCDMVGDGFGGFMYFPLHGVKIEAPKGFSIDFGVMYPREKSTDPVVVTTTYHAVELNSDGSYRLDSDGCFIKTKDAEAFEVRITIDLEALNGSCEASIDNIKGE